MRYSKPLSGTLAVLSTMVLAASLHAASVGVSFYRGNDSNGELLPYPILAPTDVAGVVPQPNWNNVNCRALEPHANGKTGPLTDDAGAVTAVTVTYQANDSWVSEGGNTTPDEKMMKGIIKAGGTSRRNAYFDIDGLNRLHAYDIYTYTVVNNSGVTVDVSARGTTNYIQETNRFFGAFILATNTDSAATRPLGNYVLFQHVVPNSDNQIVVGMKWVNGGDGAGMAGLQVVDLGVDILPPVALGANAYREIGLDTFPSRDVVQVNFNKDIDPATVIPANFTLVSAAVQTATLVDPQTVVLGLTSESLYSGDVVTINNAKAANGATIAANTQVPFTYADPGFTLRPISVNMMGSGYTDTGPDPDVVVPQPPSMDPADVAGVVALPNWNNAAQQPNAMALNDSAGAATPVTISFANTGAWANNPSIAGGTPGDQKMLTGFYEASDQNGGVDVKFSLQNVPAASYNLLAYTVNGSENETFTVNDDPSTTVKVKDQPSGNFNGTWIRGVGQSYMVCNYVQFDDVHPVGGTINMDLKADIFRGRINGLQLIPVTAAALEIVTQPADQLNKLINDPYQFSVVITNLRQPYVGQWYSNGVPIVGATKPVLTGIAYPSGNNAVFYYTATNEINGVQSATALLTVQLDSVLLSVGSQGNCHAIYLNFNLQMNLDGTYTVISSNQITAAVTPVTLGTIAYGSSQFQVVLPVSPDLLPDTNTYIVTVTGATAQNGLPVAVPTELALVHGSDYPLFQTMYRAYYGIGNIGPAALQSSARYNSTAPGAFTQTINPTGFFDTAGSFTWVADQYCGDLFGWFKVPTTGNYTFWMCSDDGGATYIATDGNPAHKTQIIDKPSWNSYREWSTAPSSAAIPLVADQVVYLEGAFSQGGGGEGYNGTYTVDSTTAPANGTSALPISSFEQRRLSPNSYAFNTLCDVSFVQPLGTVTGYVTLPITITAQVDGTPAWAPKVGYWYQWSSNGVTIVGATNATYTTVPIKVSDGGVQYACVASNNFSFASSTGTVVVSTSPVLLSASTLNQPDIITLVYSVPVWTNGTFLLTNSADEYPVDVSIVGYGSSSNIVILKAAEALPANSVSGLTITDVTAADGVSLIHLNPTFVMFGQGAVGNQCTDFATLPPNAVLYGVAALNADGSVHLTEAINSTEGTVVFTVGQPVSAFKVNYKLLMGDSVAGQADGTGFSFAPNIANGSFNEGGSGNGLIVVFNTYAGYFRGIRLVWNGTEFARQPLELAGTPAVWRDVSIQMTKDGYVTVNYAGTNVFNGIKSPIFTPLTGNAKFAFSGRCGGENEKNYIDDVCFNDYPLGEAVAVSITPLNPTVAECSTVAFNSTVTGSPNATYQWFRNGVAIAGATGLGYTTPKLFCPSDNGVVYSVTATVDLNNFTAASTVTLNCDYVAPTLVSAGSTAGGRIGAQFSKGVDPLVATNALNYSVNHAPLGDNIAGISMMPIYNNSSVIITLSNALTSAFTLTATNMVDVCPAHNSTNSTVSGTIFNASLQATNLGPAVPAGLSASFTNDDVVITGGGADIWGTSDECRFVYTERAGDFDMKVQVTRLDPTSAWSKAGLDARVLLTANSPHAMSVFTPYGPTNPKNQGDPGVNGIDTGIRPTVGGNTDGWGILGNGAYANGVSPSLSVGINWIRLQRTGNTLMAYHSADGVNWTNHASTAAGVCSTLPPSLFVGMVESSHNNGAGAAAVFKNFTLTPPGVYEPLTSCGLVAVSYDGVANVTLTWADSCCRLQGAEELNSNPALTVWTDISGTSPLTLPSGSPLVRFFRTISP